MKEHKEKVEMNYRFGEGWDKQEGGLKPVNILLSPSTSNENDL